MKGLRQEAKASQSAKMGRMTTGYAKGGFVAPDVGSDDRLPVANVAGTKSAGKIGGQKAKNRLDRPAFAAGGRAKAKDTNVTVIVAPTEKPAENVPPPMPPPAPMPPPKPPMPMPPPPPPGAGPPGGMPGGGMPVRKAGGRVKKADGGPVDDAMRRAGSQDQAAQQAQASQNALASPYNQSKGAMSDQERDYASKQLQSSRALGKKDGGRIPGIVPPSYKAKNEGTKVKNVPGKNDTDEIFPERPVGLKKAKGGRVPGYPIDDGAGSGPGRLEKIGKSA